MAAIKLPDYISEMRAISEKITEKLKEVESLVIEFNKVKEKGHSKESM